MHTHIIRSACRIVILAALVVTFSIPTDASGQLFRRGITRGACNCAMCQAIRAGTWRGSYAATFGSVARGDPVASTPMPAVRRMVELGELTDEDVVYDPGCGDGRIVEEAVRSSGCKALGIEINPGIAARARARLRNLFPRRIRIQTGDSRRLYLGRATVALMYLYPEDLRVIVPRLRNCRRIISFQHRVPGMLNRRVETESGDIYVADIPSNKPTTPTTSWDSGLSAPDTPRTSSLPEWSALSCSCDQTPPKAFPAHPISAKEDPSPFIKVTQPVLACRGGT